MRALLTTLVDSLSVHRHGVCIHGCLVYRLLLHGLVGLAVVHLIVDLRRHAVAITQSIVDI